jgi:DNA-directed RNA polymerase sigma subunit (sigma70/sigma32)
MIGGAGAAGAVTSAPALTMTGDRLSPRERRIFEARLLADEPMSYDELATEFGVARARVKQLEDRVIEKLGANLQGPEEATPSG